MFAKVSRTASRVGRRALSTTRVVGTPAMRTVVAGLAAAGVAAVGAAAATQHARAEASTSSVAAEEDPNFVPAVPTLSAKGFVAVEVSSTHDHTADSKLVTINAAPEGGKFPTASFVLVKAEIDGETVVRPYTPVHSDKRGGTVLAVKEYEEGKMSKHLCNLQPGQTVEIKGPLPKIEYKPNMVKDLVMIAGGSGITPMYQLITEVWRAPEDETKVTLLYANRSPAHIMLGHLLETLFYYRENSTLVHVLDSDAPTAMEHVYEGHLNKEILSKYLPAPSADALVTVCGPPGMVAAISGPKAKDYSQGEVSGLLKELGWDESNVFKF